jgi:hypothetical protein
MAQATIDNQKISEKITNGGSVTVPTGEVWEVTIMAQSNDDNKHLEINGTIVARVGTNHDPFFKGKFVLTGGDTVSPFDSTVYVHIGGYVVDS